MLIDTGHEHVQRVKRAMEGPGDWFVPDHIARRAIELGAVVPAPVPPVDAVEKARRTAYQCVNMIESDHYQAISRTVLAYIDAVASLAAKEPKS